MRYELRKILGNSRLCLLFIAVIILNALLFYGYCTDGSQGYTMLQIQSKYEDVEGLKAEQEELEELVMQFDIDPYSDSYMTGNIYDERHLNQAVLDRVQQAETYDEYRRGLVDDSYLKIMLGLLGEHGSFEELSLQRGAQEYEDLQGVTADASFFGGTELFASWHTSDILMLVFCIIGALMLFTYEKGAGLRMLTQPTKNGHCRLYVRKFGASVLLMTSGFVLIYGVNFLVSAAIFGVPNMSAAVQSVYGYAGCPAALSVGEFYLVLIFVKYLWALACLAAAVLICSFSGSAVASAIATAFFACLAFMLGATNNLWLKNLSLSELASAEKLLQGAVYLNFFGNPVRRFQTALLFLAFVVAAAFFAGMFIFCKMPTVGGVKLKLPEFHLTQRHTRLYAFECGKAFFMWKGLAIILAFIVVPTFSYKDFKVNNSEYEYYYRVYSQTLEGEPNAEKDAFIESERTKFEQLNERLGELYEQYGEAASYSSEVDDIQNNLRPQQAFEDAATQYENLTEGQSYLYQTGYTYVFSPYVWQENILNFGKNFFVLILLLCAFFAFEKESGVGMLQSASGKTKSVLKMKISIIAFYTVVAAAVAFLPQYIAVFNGYGGLVLSAQANSVMWLSDLSAFWSVGTYIIAVAVFRLLVSGAAAGLISVISHKTGSTMMTLVISSAVLLIPTAVAFMLC